jgi:hypothetical protein
MHHRTGGGASYYQGVKIILQRVQKLVEVAFRSLYTSLRNASMKRIH